MRGKEYGMKCGRNITQICWKKKIRVIILKEQLIRNNTKGNQCDMRIGENSVRYCATEEIRDAD